MISHGANIIALSSDNEPSSQEVDRKEIEYRIKSRSRRKKNRFLPSLALSSRISPKIEANPII